MPRVASTTRIPQTPQRRLAKLTAAAEYANVCSKTIRRWGADGRVTLYRAGPRLLLVDLDELDAMLRPLATISGK